MVFNFNNHFVDIFLANSFKTSSEQAIFAVNNFNFCFMPKNEQTSKRVAKIASQLLRDPKTPAKVKSVAGSTLTQAPNRKKSPKKK